MARNKPTSRNHPSTLPLADPERHAHEVNFTDTVQEAQGDQYGHNEHQYHADDHQHSIGHAHSVPVQEG